jgi:hypothetical protein
MVSRRPSKNISKTLGPASNVLQVKKNAMAVCSDHTRIANSDGSLSLITAKLVQQPHITFYSKKWMYDNTGFDSPNHPSNKYFASILQEAKDIEVESPVEETKKDSNDSKIRFTKNKKKTVSYNKGYRKDSYRKSVLVQKSLRSKKKSNRLHVVRDEINETSITEHLQDEHFEDEKTYRIMDKMFNKLLLEDDEDKIIESRYIKRREENPCYYFYY